MVSDETHLTSLLTFAERDTEQHENFTEAENLLIKNEQN